MEYTDTTAAAPGFAVAGSLLEALAAADFDRVATAFENDASLRALVPRGLREWHGRDEIRAAFANWFGTVEQFEVADASVGQVGARLQLRWRVRLRGERLGDAAKVVEQHAYADTTVGGRIRSMSLLCSGYCDEHVDA